MFLNYFKNLLLKYTLRNKWQEVSALSGTNSIRSVGLLIDETNFFDKEQLIKELISNGLSANSVSILVYRDAYSQYTFNSSILDWNGTIGDVVVTEFIQTEFDLLVSYYEIEKVILLLITNRSKAKFKVGFSSIDKRFNHLTITTRIGNYSIFAHELFKYLKILNKIEL
jgi:thymidine kinase